MYLCTQYDTTLLKVLELLSAIILKSTAASVWDGVDWIHLVQDRV